MRVIKVGYSTFNADAYEGMSLDDLNEMHPNMNKDVIKELAGKLGIKRKKVDKSKDKPTNK